MDWRAQADLLNFHHSLLADRARTEAYQRTIFRTVKTGDVVLDLGAGTGVLGFFACQAGAGKVYAIENSDIIELAKLVCRKNGFGERVVFIRDSFYRVELPEKVDVIVCDPDVGLFGAILDARQRFLKENGTIIPQAIEVFIVALELSDAYQKLDFWTSDLYGLDFSPVRSFAPHNRYLATAEDRSFLSEPVRLTRIAFSDAQAADVRGEASLVASRADALNGIGVWFTTEITKNLSPSDSPSIVRPDWGHSFFPLESASPVEVGDRVNVNLRSADDGRVWQWNVQIESQAERGGPSAIRKVQFKQSTLLGFPQSLDSLRKQASSHAPKLSRRGDVELFMLGEFNGEQTIRELEEEVLKRYPDVLKTRQEASALVREMVRRCS